MSYLRLALGVLIVSVCTSCSKSESVQRPNNRIIFHVFLRTEPSSDVFNDLQDICKKYGTVKIVETESIEKKDMGFLLFLSASQISEGYLSESGLPELGKALPVYKVTLSSPQFCNTPENLIFDKEQYLGISTDSKENTQKLITAFQHMLNDFDVFYKKNKNSDVNPEFWILKD